MYFPRRSPLNIIICMVVGWLESEFALGIDVIIADAKGAVIYNQCFIVAIYIKYLAFKTYLYSPTIMGHSEAFQMKFNTAFRIAFSSL